MARHVLAVLVGLHLAGCYLHHQGDEPSEGPAGTDGPDPLQPPAQPEPPLEHALCMTGRETELNAVPVDVLFVIDDSGSMGEEQQLLARALPQMVRVLATGDLDGDGAMDFPPVRDLHLGVTSTDLGVGGVLDVPLCEGLGDDAQLIDPSLISGCGTSRARFLSYDASRDDPAEIVDEFSCLAMIGTEGCFFEQPLEAALKALWPSEDVRLPGGLEIDASSISFLGDLAGGSRVGRGSDYNAGFLRHTGPEGSSLVAIVVVSDEDDCSSAETRHFLPARYLPQDDPLRDQPLGTRCYFNPQSLHSVSRYLDGYRALRGGEESLVFFAAIVGVPPDLVDERARAGVDFSDDRERAGYYDAILQDPRMQEELVHAPPGSTPQGLMASCQSASGRASPPRRFVELARDFGENVAVQSICATDFRPAMAAVLARLGKTITVATCASQH